MSFLRNVFGLSKKEIWQELCDELGFEFVEGGIFKGEDKVIARAHSWTITLDTYSVSTGKTTVTYTRMRADFINPTDFKFKIYRKGVFSDLGKMMGMQDIEVGFAEFDQAFVIQGNDQEKLVELFSHEHVRQLIQLQPKISLEIKDRGFFESNSKEEDQLYFHVPGVIKDKEQLKALFFLFAGVVKSLEEGKKS